MIVLKIIGAILYAVLKIVIGLLQIALTIVGIFFSFGMGVFERIGEIIGGLFVIGSILCLIMGIASGKEFCGMFFLGLAFGGIPASVELIGIEGITAIKDTLSKI